MLGVVSSLAASVLLVFALQQAGVVYAWNSGPIISTFVISGVLWVAFLVWQRRLSLAHGVCEPVFPWRLACNRFVLGLLLCVTITNRLFDIINLLITLSETGFLQACPSWQQSSTSPSDCKQQTEQRRSRLVSVYCHSSFAPR